MDMRQKLKTRRAPTATRFVFKMQRNAPQRVGVNDERPQEPLENR